MPNYLDTILSAVGLARKSIQIASTNPKISIDKAVESLAEHEKSIADPGRLSVVHDYKRDALFSMYRGLLESVSSSSDIPTYGTSSRDVFLSDFWKSESLLTGAVYSMAARATSLGWVVSGARNTASRHAKLLARAGSYSQVGWTQFITKSALDFFTTDNGVHWGTPRLQPSLLSQLAELEHIDSLSCVRTGSLMYPIYYSSLTGETPRYLGVADVVSFSSLPSPREDLFGLGYCAVSRAYASAKILCMLHQYDIQKLSNLPPEGLVGISGLTMDEFLAAVELWKAKREESGSSIFPHILWLLGQDAQAKIGIDFAPFSTLPESFDRETVITQYVNTLALIFGVDAREFWPVSTSSMGTAAESEIQHMKARGKGFGELVTNVERTINNEFPNGATFKFDVQDSEEDLQAANIAKAWVEALIPLATNNNTLMIQRGSNNIQNPESDQRQLPESEAFITKQQLLRLLADKGVLPNYMVESDNKTVVYDIAVMQKEVEEGDDPVIITYDPETGVIDIEREPAYNLMYMRELQKSKFTGRPISESDALRGNRVTASTIQDEIELWKTDKKLKEYANS